jgi:hypothetical protein
LINREKLKMNIQELFKLGMKRDIPELLTFEGPTLDIGASGKMVAPGAIPLGLPDWEFPRDPILAVDGSIATIHCYHFMEHLTGTDAIAFLREAERVMIPGASVLNFCMPYYNSHIQAQDLTHKSFWCEETFRTLFENRWYDPAGEWKLKVHAIFIIGIVGRNLSLQGQLIRSTD